MLTVGESFDAFITAESAKLKSGNRVFYAGSQVQRYYQFLIVILDRYRADERAFLVANDAVLTLARAGSVAQDENVHRINHAMFLLQVEIESFYLFAKILLDRMARFIEHFFGPERGLSLDSHDKLAKNIRSYCAEKGLAVDEAFLSRIVELRELVADFRDKQIA